MVHRPAPISSIDDPLPAPDSSSRIGIPLAEEWHDQQSALAAYRAQRAQLAQQLASGQGEPDAGLMAAVCAAISAPARRIVPTVEEMNAAQSLLPRLPGAAQAGDAAGYSRIYAAALLTLTLPQLGVPQAPLLQPWLARIISAAANGYALVGVTDDMAATQAAMGWCLGFHDALMAARQQGALIGGETAWRQQWLPLLGFDITAINFYSTPFNLRDFVTLFGQRRAEAFAAHPAPADNGALRVIGTIPPRAETRPRHRIALFCSHPTAHGHGIPHILWWLACLDREKFEPILVFRQLPENITLIEELLQHYRKLVDFAPIVIVHDGNLTQLQRFEFDLLYNFDDQCRGRSERPGYERLAARQVTAFYTPATTGCTAMDYFITSHDLDPVPDDAFSEQVIISPGLPFCFHYESYFGLTPRWTDRDSDIPADAVIYTMGSSMLTKVRPEFIDALLAIMRQVPNSYCVAMPSNRPKDRLHLVAMLMEKCAAAGVDPSRIRFYSINSRPLLHGLLSYSDVFLDFFPFSGTNNLMDPLALAVPCVTLCPPGYSRNRIGGCILRCLGLEALAVPTVEDYIALAVRLGQDAALRQSLKARMGREMLENSPLCDGPAFVARMEQAMLTMLAQPAQGRSTHD